MEDCIESDVPEVLLDPTISDYVRDGLFDSWERLKKKLYVVDADEIRRFDAFGTRLL